MAGATEWSKADLLRFVRDFRKGILGGRSSKNWCFAVSSPLETLLNISGVPVKLAEGEIKGNQHFWLERPDGSIIDPTADQFGLTAVYIGPLPDSYRGNKEAQTEASTPLVALTAVSASTEPHS